AVHRHLERLPLRRRLLLRPQPADHRRDHRPRHRWSERPRVRRHQRRSADRRIAAAPDLSVRRALFRSRPYPGCNQIAMASLSVRNLNKSFGAVEVLKGIDLEAETGEFIVLVGPSGCGKSTLLAMIAGLETITSGDIVIGGRVVNNVPPKDRD